MVDYAMTKACGMNFTAHRRLGSSANFGAVLVFACFLHARALDGIEADVELQAHAGTERGARQCPSG
ncbi:hypothetical protein MPLDJ20_260005 [Mesorhizobium plurifarium]|uniref:Uncharacterized protein n=1 Tax=Mesorhizobium plurifarium TaxID=69974 RepID=A0A090FD22_MESPL|nr:hypothetical protein MPLDJ20_260005 [Mesorhizobium plurifarium]